jgi:hypothetical protein
LLLWRTHLWPDQDGAGSGIVEGGPRWGAPVIVAAVVARATRAIVLVIPLAPALTLAFAAIVGVVVGGGGVVG